jgi:benzodiazapine receptor
MTTSLPPLTLPHAVFASAAPAVLMPVVLGSVVGVATGRAGVKRTYAAIKQPPLNPPAWVFGPVWTILYGLMGYASHRAFVSGTTASSPPGAVRAAHDGAALYLAQLGLNLAWMPLFFAARRPVAATLDLVALLGANVALARTWARVDAAAAWCVAPYLAWLAFATYLSAGVGVRNGWDISQREVERLEREKGDKAE